MREKFASFETKNFGPVIATAIHNGHNLREEVDSIMALSEDQRLREEDPYTGEMTVVGDTQIIGHRSRFEVDLNRSREKAVYLSPEDAWGLTVWKEKPSSRIVENSLREYDNFYAKVSELFSNLIHEHRKIVVLDIHSYNYKREGETGPEADPLLNPDVNIGTGSMNRAKWGQLVDVFIHALSEYDYPKKRLDVRENVKFRGGEFSQWIHRTFPENACCIAIEFKKFFMNEWTGIPDQKQIASIIDALRYTLPQLRDTLERI